MAYDKLHGELHGEQETITHSRTNHDKEIKENWEPLFLNSRSIEQCQPKRQAVSKTEKPK